MGATPDPRLAHAHAKVWRQLAPGVDRTVDLHHQVGHGIAAARVETAFDLRDRDGTGRVHVETGVGFERSVVAQQAERAGVQETGPGAAVHERGFDVVEQARHQSGAALVRHPRHREELRPPGRFVVAAEGSVVMVGQTVEEVARHGDFDADRVVDALRVVESGSRRGRFAHVWAPSWRSDHSIIHAPRVRPSPGDVCECRP